MNGDLISVIIPVYDVEAYLEKCINSVLKQSYDNLEIILIDDGSKDRCAEICDIYAQADERIIVIHKKNGGLSDARNAGIDVARGKYLTFVDSDDFIDEDAIGYLYQLLHENDADISCCQPKLVDENGAEMAGKHGIASAVINGKHACMSALIKECTISTTAWGKLYKRKLFEELRFPYGKYHEDVYTIYQAIALSERVTIGSDTKYAYRQRGGSIMSSEFRIKHLDAIEGNLKRAEFIDAHYPELRIYANADIIYAVNQCALRLWRHKGAIIEDGRRYDRKKILMELQKLYRCYEWDFLRGNNGLHAKMFSLLAFINLPLALRIAGIVRT